MDFAIATQPQDPDPAISEAGASGVTALSNAIAEAVKQLTAAQATIADLNGQLCAARAELAVQHVAEDLAEKLAALEAKQSMRSARGCGPSSKSWKSSGA